MLYYSSITHPHDLLTIIAAAMIQPCLPGMHTHHDWANLIFCSEEATATAMHTVQD